MSLVSVTVEIMPFLISLAAIPHPLKPFYKKIILFACHHPIDSLTNVVHITEKRCGEDSKIHIAGVLHFCNAAVYSV